MKGLKESRANALAAVLNMNIQNNQTIQLIAKPLSDGQYYVSTEDDKVRIFKGQGLDLYKLQIGGDHATPELVLKGNTYEGIANLFDSIELN